MKKTFLFILFGISITCYSQTSYSLCSIEERTLDTITDTYQITKEESSFKGKFVITPTNFTIYSGKKILFNQKAKDFKLTEESHPFAVFSHKKNKKIYFKLMTKFLTSNGFIATTVDGKTRITYTFCK